MAQISLDFGCGAQKYQAPAIKTTTEARQDLPV
jgi:hypothetical protein